MKRARPKIKNKFDILLMIIITMLLLYGTGFADLGNKRIAVLPFTSSNVPDAIKSLVRNSIITAYFSKQKFELLEVNQIKTIAQINKKNTWICSKAKCAIRAGKVLKAHYIIIGSIDKLKKYIITIRVVDVKNKKVAVIETLNIELNDSLQKKVYTSAIKTAEILLGERLPDLQKNTRFSTHVGVSYFMPLSVMNDFVNAGFGCIIGIEKKYNIFSRDFARLDLEFFYLPGKTGKAEYMYLLPATMSIGYSVPLFSIVNFTPFIGGGISYNSACYYPSGNKDSSKKNAAFQPVAKVSLASELKINSFFSIQLLPDYGCFFEKKEPVHFLNFSIAVKMNI